MRLVAAARLLLVAYLPSACLSAACPVAIAPGAAAEEVRSGLQAGERPLPFDVKDCTGPAAGKTLCYCCRYGGRPVVAIYVRQWTDEVVQLIKQTDDAVKRHRDRRLAAFVIYVNRDTPAVERRMKEIARRQRLVHTPLTICRDSPERLHDKFRISSKASVTVLMWRSMRVRENFAFASAELPRPAIEQVVERIEAVLE